MSVLAVLGLQCHAKCWLGISVLWHGLILCHVRHKTITQSPSLWSSRIYFSVFISLLYSTSYVCWINNCSSHYWMCSSFLPRDAAMLARLRSRNSLYLSVCHTRALWLIQRTYRRYFYTTWKGNPSFLPPNSGWWATSPSTWNGRSK